MVRLPAFTVLAILAPVVRILLRSLALLGILMALFWKIAGPPDFPFVGMLCTFAACGLVLAGYEALLRFLSR